MNTTKSLATVTAAAAAVAGFSFVLAPNAMAATDANKTVTTSYTQHCTTVGILGPQDFPTKVTVTGPASVKRGANFTVTTKIVITVPAKVNTAASGAGAAKQQTTFQTINVGTTRTTTPTKDITGAGNVVAPTIAVPSGKTSQISVPVISTTFKAGSTAGAATAKTGAIQGFFHLYNAAGQDTFGQQNLVCGAANKQVFTFTVS
jgi:hypothetical protein